MPGVHMLSECIHVRAADSQHPSQLLYILSLFFVFRREVKWCVRGGDALLCHAHTQLWTAVRAACVTDATLMDAAVSTENVFPTLQTAVSSAPVWYYHTHSDLHF